MQNVSLTFGPHIWVWIHPQKFMNLYSINPSTNKCLMKLTCARLSLSLQHWKNSGEKNRYNSYSLKSIVGWERIIKQVFTNWFCNNVKDRWSGIGFYPPCKLGIQSITVSWMLAENVRILGQRQKTMTHSTASRRSFSMWVNFTCPQFPHRWCNGLRWMLCM